jgi:phosphomethylpyrimidine synthase
MRISQDIRQMATNGNFSEQEILENGLKEKAKEFIDGGSVIYK